MSQAHPTTVPEQHKTDEYAVFWNHPEQPNMQLIARVEVPRYAVPESGASRLSPAKRQQLAVHFAVTSEESHAPIPIHDRHAEEFMVMHDLEEPMEFVQSQRNPTIPRCWNPNEESASEFLGGDES